MYKQLMAGTALLAISGIAHAVPVDLSTWQHDLHNGPAATGGANWTVNSGANPNDSVFQSVNGSPTVFFEAGTNAQGTSLSGSISVETGGDDDFVGFVLGYEDDEVNGAATDFYLIDWKQNNQNGGGAFGFAPAGLAISHVTAPSHAFWGHDNSSSAGVSEIARGANLGATGWVDFQTYVFDLTFTASLIEVFVDNVLELSVTAADFGLGAFDDGAFGFYNYSQSSVRYAGITEDVLPDPCIQDPSLPQCGPTGIPVPGTLLLCGLGLAAVGWSRCRPAARKYSS